MALGKTIREFGVKLSLAYDKAGYEGANRAIESMAKTIKEVGFGAAAAAGTIFGFAEAAASNAKDLELYSSTLGISTERLQELSYGAKIAANVNRDELMGALEGVSKTLDDVKRGNLEAGSTFNALGINVGAMVKSGMRADQVMAVVADRLKEINDPIARASLASKVFGGNVGTKLLPYLLKGSAGMAALGMEARKLGVVMDDKVLKSQAKFQDSLNRVLFVLKNIAYLIGGELIKKLEPLIIKFQNWVVANRKLIATGIKEFIIGLGQAMRFLLDFAIGAVETFKKFAEHVGGVGNAVKILTTAWIGFKALQIGIAIYELATAFSVMGAALLPIMPELLAISGLMVAIHDGYTLLKGGDIKDTWVYQLVEYIKGLGEHIPIISKVTKLLEGVGAAPHGAFANQASQSVDKQNSPLYGGLQGGNGNTYETTVNVGIPPGTSASQATDIVGNGVEQGLGQHLRNTRNATAGGTAY